MATPGTLHRLIARLDEPCPAALARKEAAKRIAKWQPRRMWLDAASGPPALCYVHPPRKRLTSFKLGGKGKRASAAPGGTEASGSFTMRGSFTPRGTPRGLMDIEDGAEADDDFEFE